MLCAWSSATAAPSARRPSVRFEDTTRYARGRVMQALRRGSAHPTTLRRRTELDVQRFHEAVGSLLADDLAHREGRLIALGPAAS
jgi:hypothetical protein